MKPHQLRDRFAGKANRTANLCVSLDPTVQNGADPIRIYGVNQEGLAFDSKPGKHCGQVLVRREHQSLRTAIVRDQPRPRGLRKPLGLIEKERAAERRFCSEVVLSFWNPFVKTRTAKCSQEGRLTPTFLAHDLEPLIGSRKSALDPRNADIVKVIRFVVSSLERISA